MSNDKFDTARQVLRQQKLTGERALFQSENLAVYDSVFEDGESALVLQTCRCKGMYLV